MAIFMIYDRDNIHRDPEKDQKGCYKRGDIVEVFDDNKPLVIPPAPPFMFIKLSGITKTDAQQFMVPEEVEEDDPKHPGQLRKRTIRRREWHVDWNNLSTSVKNTLLSNRYYETTHGSFRSYIKNKKTGGNA